MSHLSTEQFRNTIKAAVVQRSVKYTSAHSLAIRWKDDDTSSYVDTARLQALLRIFQFPVAEEVVIQGADTTPGWTVQVKFREILRKAKETRQGRSLVIVHYAGHGTTDAEGNFFLAERLQSNRKLPFMVFLHSHVLPDMQYDLDGVNNVDILFIMDCCYGHTILHRVPEVSARVVEIITATEANTPRALAPPANTFTAKLLGEITSRQKAGHQYIEFAEIVQALRSRAQAQIKPSHHLRLGAASICLPFTGVCPVSPTMIKPTLRAVFSVDIAQNMSKEELARFVSWIRTLPENVALTLDGVYLADSTFLILHASYSVYSKLSAMRGYNLVKEVRGPNMSSEFPQSLEKSKENVPGPKTPQK